MIEKENPKNSNKANYFLAASILISAVLVAVALTDYASKLQNPVSSQQILTPVNNYASQDIPQSVELPVKWGDSGVKMVKAGIIDLNKLESIYAQRGGLSEADKNLLISSDNGNIRLTPGNAGFILNLLWALGLSNKNPILESGPMTNPRFGNPGRFASTGGWILAKNDPMNHYSNHAFIILTPEQQAMVERISKNIYRPCCDNPIYFPDCNHGMAMLGLLELLVSQGLSESDIYKTALQVNTLWFPNEYITIAKFLESKNLSIQNADPKEILSKDFSSASGYNLITRLLSPQQNQSGGSCGV